MKRIVGGLTILLAVLLPPAQAAHKVVAANGNDAQSGSAGAPWATLLGAVSRVNPGDTIFVRGGIYPEGEIWIRADYGMGGHAGKYVTICAWPGETPVFNNSERGLIIDASYVRVQGLRFENGKPMYNTNWSGRSNHVEIIGNTFTGTAGYAAIQLTGDDNLIAKNLIRLNGNNLGTQGHGIYVQEGSGNIIRENTISGMDGYGIHVYEEHRSEDPAGYRRLIKNIIVEKNVIFASRARSGIIVAAGADGGPADIHDILIRWNTVFNNAGSGIVVQGWSPIAGIQICNNTLFGNKTGDIWIIGNVDSVQIINNVLCHSGRLTHIGARENVRHLTVRRNLYYPVPKVIENTSDTEAVEGDPGFVNPGQNDFSLRPGSPAIDAGLDLGWPYAGSAPDLGALEGNIAASVHHHSTPSPQRGGVMLENGMPNPFKQETRLRYRLNSNANVQMEIYDLSGRIVATLVSEEQPKGFYTQSWDGRDSAGKLLPSGIYFCRLRTPAEQIVQKLIITH
ncbi:MAG TPA: right-handed parallel beta-helix repeat-containing protein [bacterium]|nr:right-handed parallel beta-helix repeat-containing protein [bacterium]HQG46352.1 right-handed parallel beta-helix repeat-containing protein [bacterium]HQI48980.1 right-handed parallel beta-helix repeat-containing protein [bacterium]HQJ63844.1 right-handed parallel beta-helix repeat-containing protein [bacterium]